MDASQWTNSNIPHRPLADTPQHPPSQSRQSEQGMTRGQATVRHTDKRKEKIVVTPIESEHSIHSDSDIRQSSDDSSSATHGSDDLEGPEDRRRSWLVIFYSLVSLSLRTPYRMGITVYELIEPVAIRFHTNDGLHEVVQDMMQLQMTSHVERIYRCIRFVLFWILLSIATDSL